MTSNDTTLVFEGKLPITTKHTFWGKIACKDIATQEKYKCSCSIYCPQQISDNQKKKTLASCVTVWLVGFLFFSNLDPPPPAAALLPAGSPIHCNTLATHANHCDTLQYTATHTQHTAIYCNAHTTHCNILQLPPSRILNLHARPPLLSVFPCCGTLRHTETHRNTSQHTTTTHTSTIPSCMMPPLYCLDSLSLMNCLFINTVSSLWACGSFVCMLDNSSTFSSSSLWNLSFFLRGGNSTQSRWSCHGCGRYRAPLNLNPKPWTLT